MPRLEVGWCGLTISRRSRRRTTCEGELEVQPRAVDHTPGSVDTVRPGRVCGANGCDSPPLRSRPRLWLLDRDGVLNRRQVNGYVTTWARWETLSGVLEALRLIRATRARCAVVTNQACIGRGICARADVDALHGEFLRFLDTHGLSVDRFYVCPHAPKDGCTCRKPRPGLVLTALRDFGVAPADALLVGDSPTDVQAASVAGVRGVLVSEPGGLLSTVESMLVQTAG